MSNVSVLATTHLTGLPIDPYLVLLLQAAVFLANLAGGLVVLIAALRGLATYLFDVATIRDSAQIPKESIRLSLGRSFALALEFQVGADILSLALNPSLPEVEVLAAVIGLRTALNFFLERELRQAEKRNEISSDIEASGPPRRTGFGDAVRSINRQ